MGPKPTITDFLSFVESGEEDVLPETPHLSTSLHAPISLSLTTLPYPIRFTVRRLAKGDTTDSRPCVFRFNPSLDAFSPDGLILLRHVWARGSDSLLEPVLVDHGHNADGNPASQDNDSQFFWELAAPGDEVSVTGTLPEKYYRAMGCDCYVYTLLLPGKGNVLWDWGTAQEHVGGDLKAGGVGKLVVPGGARVTFAASYFGEYRTEIPPWLKKLSPVEPTDRVPGAPYFTVAVKGSTIVKSYDHITVTLGFTYHGVTGVDGSLEEGTATPVTFHSWAFTGSNGFTPQVQRRRGGSESDWEDCEILENYGCSWNIYDEPDVEVYVGQRDDEFASLRLGESWTTTEHLHDHLDISLPRDSTPGDRFRYRVMRSGADWWDWGSMEEHRETAVMLPCFIKANVTCPKNNGGRPKLVVPASEWFEFTLAE
ncbi:hypothetical protein N658DRAFT_458056 [Parathielavia hyrcaniae]|uniref:Uncharacterized protein n=1 Tax=Parathielavia hyrcaniae TaxID=113614 RepID=A0AAN6PUB4_9PEZI|nr:hypothetical protein N658DRAFT_458056 [Parathielavia hyrcaniae]